MITKDMLAKTKVCVPQARLFLKLFPNGAVVSVDNVLTAALAGLNLQAASEKFLSEPAAERYAEDAKNALYTHRSRMASVIKSRVSEVMEAWRDYQEALAIAFVKAWQMDHTHAAKKSAA